MIDSGLYVGTVRHRRYAPVEHAFTYPLCMAYLEVDRIPELMRASALISHNRWNCLSFHDRDHLGDPAVAPRERLAREAARLGRTLPAGRIFLLTLLRHFGYTFNPISVFYCFGAEGRLELLLAEVNNTFGETHSYAVPVGEPRPEGPKEFHVSPFIEMDCLYRWAIGEPGPALALHIDVERGGRPLLDATLSVEHRSWTAAELRRAVVRFPWLTARITAAIHWQAVRLWWKRVPVVPHPGPGRFAPAPTRHFGASWSVE